MLEFLMLFWTIPTALVGFTLFFNIIFFNGSLMKNILFKIMAVTYYIFFILIILFLVIECNIIEHLTV